MAIILNEWNRILASAPWSARRLHRAVFHDGYIYIAGGTDDYYNEYQFRKFNDVWRSPDGVTWELVVSNAGWPKRAAHAFIYYDNRFWILGGSGQEVDQFYNDVWYSYDAISWTQATAFASWPGRHEFGCTVFDNKMWVVGGYDGGMMSDVWYSTDGASWTLATSNFGMGVRELVLASFLNKLWVYGGDIGGYTNAMYSSTNGSSWVFEGNAAWSGRKEHEILNVTGEDRLVLLGGNNGSDLNDVWETTNGTTWTSIPQVASFPVRGDFGFTDDGSRAYIIGGLGGSTYYNDVWVGNIFPTAEFSATPLSGAIDLEVTFTDESSGSPETWDWDFGDGSPHSYVQNPSHTYTDVGTYTVSLTITKSGSPDSTEVKNDYITTTVISDFTVDITAGAPDLTVNFTNLTTGNIDSWDWDFGDGSPHSYDQNPTHIYDTLGVYTVTLIAYKDSIPYPEVKPDYINVAVIPEFTANVTSGPINTNVVFTNLTVGDIDSWEWDFGDGSPHSTLKDPSHVYSVPGIYTVSLTASLGAVSETETKTNYITINIAADFSATPLITTAGSTVSFTDLTDYLPDTWNWNFGDGSPHSTEQNPSHIYMNSGTYTVTLIVYKNSVTDTEIKTGYITVSVAADFVATPLKTTVNEEIQFFDQSLGSPTAWVWNFGDGSQLSNLRNPVHSYPSPGVYTISLEASNGDFLGYKTKEHYIEITLDEIGTGFVRDKGPTLIFD